MTATEPFPSWTPESQGEDEFAEIAAQARYGVQQKAADDAAKRRRQRVYTTAGITVVVAGAIVFLVDRFYDPDARARDQAIAAEVTRMAEQQKVTDNLTLIEIDIENAIMNNDLDTARRELATLIEKSPNHARREFLEKSIDRAAELARLSPQNADKGPDKGVEKTVQAAVLPGERSTPRARTPERPPARTPERAAARPPDRTPSARTERVPPASGRSFGAPINETSREAVIPLDAPINAPPTYAVRRPDNSFAGRTVEASDSGVGRSSAPAAAVSQPPSTQAPVTQAPVTNSAVSAPPSSAGSAAAPMPSAAPAAAPQPPAPVNVVPAKIVKRVMPVAPSGMSRKTTGYVVLTYNIGTNGRVSDVEVLESQPQGVFDDSARDAVRRWIYEARKENGVAVASPGKARLVFDGSASN